MLGINADPVSIKQVEVEIIDRAWDEGWVTPHYRRREDRQARRRHRLGPRGARRAQQLTRAGHDVLVLERADRIGGLLRNGIPEFKMEKRPHRDRRIAQMEAEGNRVPPNAVVGQNVDNRRAARHSDAVVLACGATAWPRSPSRARP